jgi:hypothetical protein
VGDPTTEKYFIAFCELIPTVVLYLIPVLCFGYPVLYMLKFTRLVERNFNLVPRNCVFSYMNYAKNLKSPIIFIEVPTKLIAMNMIQYLTNNN